MTRAEHLQSIFLPRRRYKCSLCYEDQFTSYSMLCKVIILTVNDSEKSDDVLKFSSTIWQHLNHMSL